MKQTNLVIIIIYTLISTSIVKSQTNYVPNASFEEIEHCPEVGSQLILAKGWFSPNIGTPDLFNNCAKQGTGTSLPVSSFSIYRLPKSGKGCAGIYTYYTPGFNSEDREYASIKLLKSLKSNKSYYFEFYTVTRYFLQTVGSSQCFSDAIGMAVTKDTIIETTPFKRLNLKPIAFNKGKILDDTTGWTKISNIYRGNGEKYIHIGNFEPNATTLNTKESCESGFFGHSYYFIDDVAVYEYDPLPDTLLLCKGQSMQIGSRFLDAKYKWNTGATDSVISINKAGRYIVTAIMNGKHELSDTVYILDPKTILSAFLNDTSFCKGGNINLSLPNIGRFKWSNTSISNIFSTNLGGSYQLTLTTDCGTYQHEINVTEEDCNCDVYIPNIFSPNDDQRNDELNCYVKCGKQFKVLSFQIFDRWGNQVYLLTNALYSSISWNGTFQNKLAEQGLYTYYLEYNYVKNKQTLKGRKVGDFFLIN